MLSQVAQGPARETPLLEIRGLHKHFPITRGLLFKRHVGDIKAVDGVDLHINRGETLGLVGESGCGKTTIGRCILKLEAPTHGEIRFDGDDVDGFDPDQTRTFRRRVQAIFQDPYSSLNPRMRVGDIVAEPFIIHDLLGETGARARRVRELLDLCGLPGAIAERFPHEMSGGQRQRVGIARALALNPSLVVCDEAVSALDVSIQAQIINLLEDLRDELGLTYLFIGHDLSVVRHLCHRVAVMYLGRIVEMSESDAIFDRPLHPYTRALLSAVPVPDPIIEQQRDHEPLGGEVPSAMNPPAGCVFHPRCALATDTCRTQVPPLNERRPGHWSACPITG